jgi:hypothetical protein
MFCENCKIEHRIEYGSGRFCSKKCARSFSTKSKRKEINEKVSKSLTGKSNSTKGKKLGPRSEETKEKIRLAFTTERRQEAYRKTRELREQRFNLMSFDDLSLKQKKKRIIKEQNYCCLHCFLNEWMGQKIILELDHIDGNKNNSERKNNMS